MLVMRRLIPLALAAIMTPGLLNAQEGYFDNSPVHDFDLVRYLGTWYEIARYDHSFERGMDNVEVDVLQTLKKAGVTKNYSPNYMEGLSPSAYADIYSKIKVSDKILNYLLV